MIDYQELSTSNISSFCDSTGMCIIHHITKVIINEIVESEEFLQKFDGRNIRLEYIDSMDCNADNTTTNSATIRLGRHFLEDMWILCHDIYNNESYIKSIFISNDSGATGTLVNSYTFEEDTKSKKIFEHIIETDSLSDSLDSISFNQAYKVYKNAVKFVFLHECGHVHLTHQKTNVYEEEKSADEFAENYMKDEVIGDLDLEKSAIEGIIIALAIILKNEDFAQPQEHPWAIERIIDALNVFENCRNDEFEKFCYELTRHIVAKKNHAIILPQLDSNKYIDAMTKFYNDLPKHK